MSYIRSKNTAVALPIPKVKLLQELSPSINYKQYSSNFIGGSFVLYNPPVVLTTDLDQSFIDKGVYVEMLHYIHSSGRKNGYVVPVSWIGGVNLFAGNRERGGNEQFYDGISSQPLLIDRPNHYKVVSKNETINVFEYLNNRMTNRQCDYKEAGSINSITLLTPAVNSRAGRLSGSSRTNIGINIRRYYFKFRYVIYDSIKKEFIAGPLSDTVELYYKNYPFRLDIDRFVDFKTKEYTANPSFNPFVMECRIK